MWWSCFFVFFRGWGGVLIPTYLLVCTYITVGSACVVGLDFPPQQRTVVHWKVRRPDLITVSLTAVVGLGQCSA